MKLLHLSDLHFTADAAANAPLDHRIGVIKQRYPHHVFIITGDIIDNEGAVVPGTPLPVPGGDLGAILPTALKHRPPPFGPIGPHLAVTRRALSIARASLSSLPRGRVIMCAGNHDFGLWGTIYANEFVQAFDDELFLPMLPAAGGGSGAIMCSPVDDRYPVMGSAHPWLYTISEDNINAALISVNTSATALTAGALTAGQPVLARGEVGALQSSALERTVLNPLSGILGNILGPKIVMMHHHPWVHDLQTELVDASTFMEVVRKGSVDLIMFGHQHHEKRYEPSEIVNGGLRFGALAAGSSRTEDYAWEVQIASSHGFPPTFNMSFRPVPIT